MVKNYLRVALRNLTAHKTFSLLSIAGLAAGMSVCLLIITFVRQQSSYDRFHEHADRLYHIYSDYKAPVNNSSHLYATSPVTLGQALRDNVPAVADFITLRRFAGTVTKSKEELQVTGLYASPSILHLLDMNLVQGEAATALQQPFSAVLSQSAAERLFGAENPVGKTITFEAQGDFLVTGLMGPSKGLSIFENDILISFTTLDAGESERQRLSPWDRTVRSSYTFVLLKEGARRSDLTDHFPEIIANYFPGNSNSNLVALHTQRLTDVTMGPMMDNQLKFVLPPLVLYVLAGLALVILAAACFNYVSLAVARALSRAKEIGVRKVVGAGRPQIVGQFLVEAVCTAILATALAGPLLLWFVHGFNQLTPIVFTKAQISPDFSDAALYFLFAAFSIVVGLLSGLYPAIYLSSFVPTVVLKGFSTARGRGIMLRKILMTGQFSLSLIFIISAILLYQQAGHVSTTDYGFNEKGVLNVELEGVPYELFRAELLRHPGVGNVSAVSLLTGSGGRNDTWLKSDSLTEHIKGYSLWVDDQAIPNLEIELLAGRNFSDSSTGKAEPGIILNETAVTTLGLGTPAEAVGQFATIDDSARSQIIGVVRDFRFFSALATIDPLVLRVDPKELRVANIRCASKDFDQVVAHLHSVWDSFRPEKTPQYKFYEEQLAEALELRLMRDFLHLIALAAGFAILITCLGLFGMTAYMTRTRLREVGVRKILGATTLRMVGLLAASWGKLVAAATCVAIPLAWFLNNLWLQNVGNHIEMQFLPFASGVLVLLLISALTIGSQTLRAAKMNPVEILKYE